MDFDPAQSQAEVILLIESITLVIAVGFILLSCACVPIFIYYIVKWKNRNGDRVKSSTQRRESLSEDDTVELMVEQYSDFDDPTKQV